MVYSGTTPINGSVHISEVPLFQGFIACKKTILGERKGVLSTCSSLCSGDERSRARVLRNHVVRRLGVTGTWTVHHEIWVQLYLREGGGGGEEGGERKEGGGGGEEGRREEGGRGMRGGRREGKREGRGKEAGKERAYL